MKDLTGQRFGRLVVLSRAENYIQKNGTKHSQWICKCDCGETIKVRGCNLMSGNTNSCGCYMKKRASEANSKHKQSKTKLYFVWQKIKGRCLNKTNKRYSLYGERGIKICDEWKESFENFYSWSMNNGYKTGLTIDRKDNNGNYEPSNCRWVDIKTQSNNRRTNVCFEYNGEKLTRQQICEKYNINYSCFRKRIALGWTLEKAITTPSGEKK